MKLQAFRGVGTECPANTLPAFQSAVEQGYDAYSLDVAATCDGALVVHHDRERIFRQSYMRLLDCDFGIEFSNKFTGTRICVLEEVLVFAQRYEKKVSISASWQQLSRDEQDKFFTMVEKYKETVELNCVSIDALKIAAVRAPECGLQYCGAVTEKILETLSQVVPAEKLTVWLSGDDTALAVSVKDYAKLGIRLLTDYNELDAAEALGADIVETPGQLKPAMNVGVFADMHTHSRNSHDAFTPVLKIANAAKEKGVKVMAVTDHCDVFMATGNPGFDMYSNLIASYDEAKAADKEMGDDFKVLTGVELGEAFWYPEQTRKVLELVPYDVVIGATHAVKSRHVEGKTGMQQAFSQFKWEEWSEEEIYEYFDLYFDDVLYTVQTQNMDIMPHLGCVRGYIRRKCGWLADFHPYEGKIRKILETIIRRGIALEVQTSYWEMWGCMNPDDWIVEMYRDMGGYLITMSTDAHDSKRAGISFPEVAAKLKEIGFRNVYYVEKRRFHQCTLV